MEKNSPSPAPKKRRFRELSQSPTHNFALENRADILHGSMKRSRQDLSNELKMVTDGHSDCEHDQEDEQGVRSRESTETGHENDVWVDIPEKGGAGQPKLSLCVLLDRSFDSWKSWNREQVSEAVRIALNKGGLSCGGFRLGKRVGEVCVYFRTEGSHAEAVEMLQEAQDPTARLNLLLKGGTLARAIYSLPTSNQVLIIEDLAAVSCELWAPGGPGVQLYGHQGLQVWSDRTHGKGLHARSQVPQTRVQQAEQL